MLAPNIHRVVHKNAVAQAYARVKVFVALVFFPFFLFLVSCFLFSTSAHAASYSFSPASGSYEVGKTFTVSVMVDPGTDAVNTGDGALSYDTAKLTAVSVSKEGSVFNLWVTEPALNAGAGTVTFAGGATTPFSGSKRVVTVSFKAKAEGAATVKLDKGTLLAGAGQNVLAGSLPTASFTITPAAAKPPVEEKPDTPAPAKPARAVNIPVPDAPVIKSSTHKEEGTWYNQNTVKLTWDLPYGVTGLKKLWSEKADAEPTEVHEPPIPDWTKENVADGVWYFHAAYKNRGGWGSSTAFKVQIDTTPPKEFTVTGTGGDLAAQLSWAAEDELSGVVVYRIAVDDGRPRDVQPSELIAGGYTLTNIDPGEHSIIVTAVDAAGNEREARTKVTATGELPPAEGAQEVETSGFGAIYWVSLIFMALLAGAVTLLVLERRKHHEERELIKREAMEAGDKLINVFGVLRDEIEERVLDLSHKPNMTDNEREILEGLKDALDVSEELIDKEIEDIRKLLK